MPSQPITRHPPIARLLRRRLTRGRNRGQTAPPLVGFSATPAGVQTPEPFSIEALIAQWIDSNPPQLYRGGA